MAEEQQQDETRSPEEIRADIEETRAELGDTVEALAQKSDVKAQAKERVDGAKAQAKERVEGVKEKVTGAAPADVSAKAQENPLPFAVGGALVAGFLLGRITKRS